MRIVAGSRKGARLAAAPGRQLRPTPDRVREALFGILDGGRFGDPYRGRLVVDAFAGTGALGLEALSRGAGQAVFIENAPASLAVLNQNIDALKLRQAVTVIDADATLLPRPAPGAAGLILLDPPYRSGLSASCLDALRRQGWTGADTLAVVELGADEPDELPDWLRVAEERRYGATRLVFAAAA